MKKRSGVACRLENVEKVGKRIKSSPAVKGANEGGTVAIKAEGKNAREWRVTLGGACEAAVQ